MVSIPDEAIATPACLRAFFYHGDTVAVPRQSGGGGDTTHASANYQSV
jgi:hypothetical protein